MAPRTQLGAPSVVKTVLRGRDINRTYVQGHEEGDECFPKVEIKVISDILLLLVFSHGALAAQETKKSKEKVRRAFHQGCICPPAWPGQEGLRWGLELNPAGSGHTRAGSPGSSCPGGCPALQQDAGLVWISFTGPVTTCSLRAHGAYLHLHSTFVLIIDL